MVGPREIQVRLMDRLVTCDKINKSSKFPRDAKPDGKIDDTEIGPFKATKIQ